MQTLIDYVQSHSQHAPWVVFGATLLAGLNVPISIDILLALSAILAATTAPHLAIPLFLSLFIGCSLSAYLAYWVGRGLRPQLSKVALFKKPLSDETLERVHNFYARYGIWTFIVGRFIPFGVRNCLFMSSGASKLHFGKFAYRDGIACFIWSITLFSLFYSVGLNLDSLFVLIKKFNIAIFSAFSIAVICIFWYKRARKSQK